MDCPQCLWHSCHSRISLYQHPGDSLPFFSVFDLFSTATFSASLVYSFFSQKTSFLEVASQEWCMGGQFFDTSHVLKCLYFTLHLTESALLTGLQHLSLRFLSVNKLCPVATWWPCDQPGLVIGPGVKLGQLMSFPETVLSEGTIFLQTEERSSGPLSWHSLTKGLQQQPRSQLLPALRERQGVLGVRREAVRIILGPAALSSTGESPDSPTDWVPPTRTKGPMNTCCAS